MNVKTVHGHEFLIFLHFRLGLTLSHRLITYYVPGLETESRERINPVHFGGAHIRAALYGTPPGTRDRCRSGPLVVLKRHFEDFIHPINTAQPKRGIFLLTRIIL